MNINLVMLTVLLTVLKCPFAWHRIGTFAEQNCRMYVCMELVELA